MSAFLRSLQGAKRLNPCFITIEFAKATTDDFEKTPYDTFIGYASKWRRRASALGLARETLSLEGNDYLL